MTEFESVITRGMTPISEERRERAVLVGVDRPGSTWPLASSLAELERLVDTAGADAVATTTQKLDAPDPRTFVGTGKAEEVAELARAHAADLVVFDDELTPSQQANLEKAMGRDVKVIDRTALILDIFALHATSKEGRLQVRLAQNEYLLPRLRGMWAHLASNRMGGGVGSRFGEGESQLEVDRRMVRKRITSIKRELKHLAEVRAVQRESRYESGMFKVALAGYTNAGKSSLLNRLTNADVLAYDKLFATLDSTTRKFELPEGREITVTDTVAVHPEASDHAHRGVQIDARRNHGRRPRAARGGCLVGRVRGADRGRRGRAGADTRAGPVARARVQQVRPARRGAPRRP